MHDGRVSYFDRHPRLRWAVPASAGLLIAAGAVIGTTGVSADSGLHPMTAEELLVDLQDPQAEALSGTVVVTTDLGLPELPVGMGSGGTNLTSLMSGTHTLRVWSAADGSSRVDLLAPRGEYNIVRNGSDLWIWDSAESSVEHAVLSDKEPGRDLSSLDGSMPSTPQEAATLALSAIDPTTEVSVTGAGSVAGRSVYELSLTPRQPGTKVARIVIAVDAETRVPLRVQAFSTETQAPAVDVGFTSVDFSAPDPAVFAFVPPPGAEVNEMTADGDGAGAPSEAAPEGAKPTVVGEGWNSVVIAAMPQGQPLDDTGAGEASAQQTMQALPTISGDWGSGRILDGTLMTVIVTDDGRVAAGAVTREVLEAALAAA
jgi:outer membrane lipoprotein-sorting protein